MRAKADIRTRSERKQRLRLLLLLIASAVLLGCEFHSQSSDSRSMDMSIEISDRIAHNMILERLDAENLEYWIDDEGRIRISKEIKSSYDAISDEVFEHRSGGTWIQYGGGVCDYQAVLIEVLKERDLEYVVEPIGADETEGDFVHWYPSREFPKEAIYAEVDARACPNRAKDCAQREVVSRDSSGGGQSCLDKGPIISAPFYDNGVMQGYRVYPGQDKELFDSAGLRFGDLIVAIEGRPLTDAQMLKNLLADISAGDPVQVTVVREGIYKDVDLLQENLDFE